MVSTIVMFPSNVNSARRNPSRVTTLNKSGSKKYAMRIAIMLLLGASVHAMHDAKEKSREILRHMTCWEREGFNFQRSKYTFKQMIDAHHSHRENIIKILVNNTRKWNIDWDSQILNKKIRWQDEEEDIRTFSPVFYLVKKCNPKMLKKLLVQLLRVKKIRDACMIPEETYGFSLLHEIVETYQDERQLTKGVVNQKIANSIVDLLVNRLGVDILKSEDGNGSTPLEWAQEFETDDETNRPSAIGQIWINAIGNAKMRKRQIEKAMKEAKRDGCTKYCGGDAGKGEFVLDQINLFLEYEQKEDFTG